MKRQGTRYCLVNGQNFHGEARVGTLVCILVAGAQSGSGESFESFESFIIDALSTPLHDRRLPFNFPRRV